MTAPNAARAYAVLDRIDADPDSHDQGWWFMRSECGTTACFAGLTCIIAGDQPDFDVDGDSSPEDGWTYTGALKTVDGGESSASVRARDLLGIDYLQGKRLFYGSNTREQLGDLVAEIFGPRPGEHVNCPHDPEGADGNPFAAMICSPMTVTS